MKGLILVDSITALVFQIAIETSSSRGLKTQVKLELLFTPSIIQIFSLSILVLLITSLMPLLPLFTNFKSVCPMDKNNQDYFDVKVT